MATYSIYKDGELINSKLHAPEVSKIIGIHRAQVSTYASKKWKYKRSYDIKIDGETIKDEWEKDFKKDWENVQKAASICKNGGHIVSIGERKYAVNG